MSGKLLIANSNNRYPDPKGPALGCPIRGFITKYMNERNQKSEFRIALNCINTGERMNIERPTSNFKFQKMKKQK
jgi:hypothetical protein